MFQEFFNKATTSANKVALDTERAYYLNQINDIKKHWVRKLKYLLK